MTKFTGILLVFAYLATGCGSATYIIGHPKPATDGYGAAVGVVFLWPILAGYGLARAVDEKTTGASK